ncbi:MAG: hypothetical protein U5P41_01795 [Gammaproteobacteria bacterium]|nr:hypothetical protein [Gammaproteobacteria bacterium]
MAAARHGRGYPCCLAVTGCRNIQPLVSGRAGHHRSVNAAVAAAPHSLRHQSLVAASLAAATLAVLVDTCGHTRLCYFAGEEVSWGQHFFDWQTPEELATINDQRETNLHNISSWFDQKPRFLLELFVLFGGVILPAWRLTAGEVFSTESGSFWFWPACVCLPSALLAILVYMPDRLISGIDYSESGMLRLSEIQELFYAVFLFIYLASIAARLKRRRSHQAVAAPAGS